MSAMDRRIPWAPDIEGAPVQISLDSRSLAVLIGQDAADAQYLVDLAKTEHVDALVVWARDGYASHLPAAEMREGRGLLDSITVGLRGEPHGFIGGIPYADQWAEIAERDELDESEKEWFVHYGRAIKFHSGASRHLFVTADEKLLRQKKEGPYKNLRRPVFSVKQALYLVGVVMRKYGRVYYKAERGHKAYTANAQARETFALTALPNRARLYRWIDSVGGDAQRAREMVELEESLGARAKNLFRAREGVEEATFSPRQEHAEVDEAIYHLRAGVAALAAALDSFAALACLALGVELSELKQQEVGVREKAWKVKVREAGGARTAAAAIEAGPLLKVVKTFRDPIVHRAGIVGWPVRHVGANAFDEIEINDVSDEQVEAIEGLGKTSGEPDRWGLRKGALGASLAPFAFATRLTVDGCAALDSLLEALCEDLAAPPFDLELQWTNEHLRRVRLLNGLIRGSD